MDDAKTADWLVGTIRAEMVRNRLTYAHLVELLGTIGIEENERNLRNKVKRGTFSAAFYVQCLVALGVSTIRLDDPRLVGKVPLAPLEDRVTRQPKDERTGDQIIADVEALVRQTEQTREP